MTLNSTLSSFDKYSLREHCHINTNEDGDNFVGIKADSENAMIYFPIGYQLPESDEEIRRDIRHLISVLSEFTTKNDRLLAMQKFATPQTVDFPVNAFRSVIEYFLNHGYYVEYEKVHKSGTTGKKDWERTVRNKKPLVQLQDGVASLIFTDFDIIEKSPNDTKLITQINRYCVSEAFERLGWLYIPNQPEQPGPHPDIKTSIGIVKAKLSNTNEDKKRQLFQSMISMLTFLDENTSDKQFYFGTDNFENVWEQLIDCAFGEKNKEDYFPKTRWLLDKHANKELHPLIPDSIMIYKDKYYVLDAKYYKYGWTADPYHLPNGSSINKQITYGEYLENNSNIPHASLFNAFIMPFNQVKNHFEIDSYVGNIGEAIGDWRINQKYYERIQGIVFDTRHLMFNYMGRPQKERDALARCIELVINRDEIE